MAPAMVKAIGRKMRPSTRWKVKIGIRATIRISLEKSIGRPRFVPTWRTSSRKSRGRRRAGRRGGVGAWGGSAGRSSTPGRRQETALATSTASTITTAASTRMPKSTAPKESRLAAMPRTCSRRNADSSASGMTSQMMKRRPEVAGEDQGDDQDQHAALDQVVQDRVHRLVDQVRAVVDGDQLHALGQHVGVQVGHLLLDAGDDLGGVGALVVEDDALDDVVGLLLLAAGAGLVPGDDALARGGVGADAGDVADVDGVAVVGGDGRCSRCRAGLRTALTPRTTRLCSPVRRTLPPVLALLFCRAVKTWARVTLCWSSSSGRASTWICLTPPPKATTSPTPGTWRRAGSITQSSQRADLGQPLALAVVRVVVVELLGRVMLAHVAVEQVGVDLDDVAEDLAGAGGHGPELPLRRRRGG